MNKNGDYIVNCDPPTQEKFWENEAKLKIKLWEFLHRTHEANHKAWIGVDGELMEFYQKYKKQLADANNSIDLRNNILSKLTEAERREIGFNAEKQEHFTISDLLGVSKYK